MATKSTSSRTYEIPTESGVQIVSANSKAEALGQVNNATLKTNSLNVTGNLNQTSTFNPQSSNLPPISYSTISSQPKFNLPSAPIYTETGGMQGAITSTIDSAKAERQKLEQQKIDEAKNAKDSNLKDILQIQDILGNEGKRTEELYKQGGVDEARKQVDEYTSQLEAEDLALRRKLEALDKNPQGLFGGGLQQEKDRVTRESLSKQADLAILQNAALRKHDTASAIADRKVKLELEPLKAKLESLKFIYGENKDLFNTAEKRQYESIIRDEENAYNEALTNKTNVSNLSLELGKNGAPASILQKALQAKTPNEILAIPGIQNYLLSQADRLDIAIKSQTLQEKKDAAKVAEEAAKLGLLTPDQAKNATDLRKEYNGLEQVKNLAKSETDTKAILNAIKGGKPTDDIAAINSFQRIAVDPGVSVREGDVALLQTANNFGDKAWLKTNGYLQGNKLTQNARDDMQALVLKIHDARIASALDQTFPIRATAKVYGIDFDKYVATPPKNSQTLLEEVTGQQKSTTEKASDYVNSIDTFFSASNSNNPFSSLLINAQ